MKKSFEDSKITIYETEDGQTRLYVKIEGETVWLTQDQMAELFEKSKSTINEHIKNIYEEKELVEGQTMRKFGNSEFSTKPTNCYNLDVIISVGYRVKSVRGTQFRIWATQRLKEYIVKIFTLLVLITAKTTILLKSFSLLCRIKCTTRFTAIPRRKL